MDKKSIGDSTALPDLAGMAQHINAAARWANLALPQNLTAQLKALCNQIQQGREPLHLKSESVKGTCALFSGPHGTAKTLAAEAIANALHLELYRIDLEAVVSKHIGETEKNLRQLFDAAKDAGVILFFDEADALFGKRTEVKDAHDRYANLEVDYLLQLIADHTGVVILATNSNDALDSAFIRRLRNLIKLPFPSAAARGEHWRDDLATENWPPEPAPKQFPPKAPS
jgi:SpoVK/Ycf46/Vps4 family AAA+-type ATPase